MSGNSSLNGRYTSFIGMKPQIALIVFAAYAKTAESEVIGTRAVVAVEETDDIIAV